MANSSHTRAHINGLKNTFSNKEKEKEGGLKSTSGATYDEFVGDVLTIGIGLTVMSNSYVTRSMVDDVPSFYIVTFMVGFTY